MDAGEFVVSDGLVLTHWRNVFVNVWKAEASVTFFRAVRRVRTELRRKFPHGTATITVLDTQILSLSPEARAEASALTREFDGSSLGVAHVLEGTGFGAAARRMLLSGVLALDRRRAPTKTFESTLAASRWLAEQLAGAAERDRFTAQLAAHVEAARRVR